MNPKQAPDSHASAATLGDLLYSDPTGPTPEEEWVSLVEAIARADQEALRALYERSHRIVFTLAVRICKSRELADEVTLDVFHDVWRRAASYDPSGGSVVGWIMNQTRSRAIDRMRFEQRKKRAPPESIGGAEQPSDIDDTIDASDAIEAQQRTRMLRSALTALTSDERRAIETAFFSELTYAETAARLDEPVGTVKTRVRSALAKLRKALESDGGEP